MVFKESQAAAKLPGGLGLAPWEYVDTGHAGVNSVPVRIVVPKGRAPEAKYAAEVTATILTRLEDYFGIPYPYEKADQVSVPMSGGFGAMENAGMVTYEQPVWRTRRPIPSHASATTRQWPLTNWRTSGSATR